MGALRSRIARIRHLAGQAGKAPPTVLIQGETGTGKDLAARALHFGSDRARRPFVHVDCTALPKDLIEAELFGHEKGAFTHAHTARTGLIEAAEDGTAYLDEIGELPLELQSRLLAVLERREVRRIGSTPAPAVAAWFIAATNRDLDDMVSRGAFRSDLYFRLKVLSLDIPPLRERLDDLAPLFEHFAALTARRYGMPAPTLSPECWRRRAATTGRGMCESLRTRSSARYFSAPISGPTRSRSASRRRHPWPLSIRWTFWTVSRSTRRSDGSLRVRCTRRAAMCPSPPDDSASPEWRFVTASGSSESSPAGRERASR